MRKSRMRSPLGHLGGLEQGLGIIPPAAAAFDRASRPENDPILKEILTPEELAQVSQVRRLEASKRTRLHSHEEQTQNDQMRELQIAAIVRNEKNIESAVGRRRSKAGDVYKLGSTSPLSEAEAAELAGTVVVALPVNPDSEVAIDVNAEIPTESAAPGKSPAKKKTKRKKLAPVSAEDAAGEGGSPRFSNSMEKNPRPMLPSSGRKSRSRQ